MSIDKVIILGIASNAWANILSFGDIFARKVPEGDTTT